MARKGTDLQGAVVWLTGASSGIGAALAEVLASRGARVALSARREEQLARVCDRLARPEDHLVLPLDATAIDRFGEAHARVREGLGPVDVLLLNAGIGQRSYALETRLEVDRRIVEVDFFGPVALTKEVLPSMVERGSGRIVVVTSLVGRIGSPKRTAYAGAKHALHGYFESLRAEIWSSGVRITLAAPGYIHTELPVNALTGDGSPQGFMDRAQLEGMSPERCAERIVRAIEKGRDEVLVAGIEGLGVPLFRFFPWLFRRVVRKVRVT